MRLRIRAMKLHGHALFDSSPPDFDPVVHADVTPRAPGGKRCASETSAWIAGSSLAMTKENERKKYRRRNADRRNPYSAVPYGHGRASNVRRTSIGVPPRFSPQGVFHRKGLSTRLLLPGTWRPGLACPSSGRYPPLPVPVQRPNAPRS
jgi:hypothetical protein